MDYSTTGTGVRELFAEFQSLKSYKDKIVFYDQYFGISIDEFPPFSPKLEIFFQMEESNALVELFEKERRSSLNLEKTVVSDNHVFVFNVSPINSYAEIFNDFIVSKFLDTDLNFKSVMQNIQCINLEDPGYLFQKESESRHLIEVIQQKCQNTMETGIRGKFMTVFYEGYSDQLNNNLKTFSKRKKLIELYLYSQGIMYARYVFTLLKTCNNYSGPDNSIPARMQLLKEAGVLDFLQHKFPGTNDAEGNTQLVGFISQVLGIKSDSLKGYLKQYL